MEASQLSNEMTIQSHKGPYKVFFADNPFADLEQEISGHKHFIIDAAVARCFQKELAPLLAHHSTLIVEAEESNKSLERMPDYVAHLIDAKIRRGDTLIAVGGGIIQDITCFLAATMLRGLDWIFYPTTLLAQTDSCIGSKSSINVGSVKNILGTYTPPKKIKIGLEFLKTLGEDEIRSGIGEMIKVHIIDGQRSIEDLARDYDNLLTCRATLSAYILKSLMIKKRFIEEDEFDTGTRNILNYGHTFGHAIEAATAFGIPHGIAVTIGMDMANFLSFRTGLIDEQTFYKLHKVLHTNYSKFASVVIPLDSFLVAIMKDKKNVGQKMALILLDGSGQVAKRLFEKDQFFQETCRVFLQEIILQH
jgi:3-dehydroquinate synthase